MRFPAIAAGLGIAGLSCSSLCAVELAEGFSLAGFGEAFARVEHHDLDAVANTTKGTADQRAETFVDFTADVDLKLRYQVDQFTLRSDVLFYSKQQFGDNVLLEQAFIDWKTSDSLTVRAGRFQNTWLGWEGFHTPELWRVNHSAAWDWNVTNHGGPAPKPFVSDGVGALFSLPNVPITAQFYVVNDVLGDGPGATAADKAVGASFAFKPEGIGRFELGLAYDPRSVFNGTAIASDAVAVDVNADIDAFKGAGWFFAGEFQFHDHPQLVFNGELYGNDWVALVMANYAFTPTLSLTVMVDHVERGIRASDNEVTEYALALLTRPHAQVRFNCEVFYWGETAKDSDSYGGAAVLLVQLP